MNRRETVESLKRLRDYINRPDVSDEDARGIAKISPMMTIRQMESPEHDRTVRVGDVRPTALEELDRRMRNARARAAADGLTAEPFSSL